MAISLKKGQKIDLTKGNANLKHILIGLGWESQGSDFDLDTAAFMLNANGKVLSDNEFIFYGNLKHPSGSVEHKGDNITGNSDGDAKQIVIDLNQVPQNIEKIDFTATIYDADTRKQNFGMMKNAYIRAVNADTDEEILRYDLGSEFSVETAVVAAEIYRHNGEWKFNAIGSGFSGGLAALCKNFGIDVSDGQGVSLADTQSQAVPSHTSSAPHENILKIGSAPVNLKKGQKISLEKKYGTNLRRVMVGLGWDPAESYLDGFFSVITGITGSIDLDATAFVCVNGKLKNKSDIVYFGNLKHNSGAVKHMGDNLTGDGDGDDEQIFVDLERLPPKYDKISFVVNIFHFFKTKQHFGMIKNAFIRICDNDTHKELCRYNLSDNYDGMKAVIFGELYRKGGKWLFKSIGKGTTDDSIDELAERYR